MNNIIEGINIINKTPIKEMTKISTNIMYIFILTAVISLIILIVRSWPLSLATG